LRKYCKDCLRARKRKWYQENKDRVAAQRRKWKPWRSEEFREYRRDWQLQDRYGITLKEFEQMSEAQNGVCAICGNEPDSNQKGNTLHVDHCHEAGEIRGLLCNHCNVGLANFRNDPDALRRAAEYLETWKANGVKYVEVSE